MNAVDDETIAKVLRDPPLIWKVIAPDDPEKYAESRTTSPSWFARLFGKARPAPVSDAAEDFSPDVIESDLDKAWHGIHYLLTGSAWGGDPPLNFLVLGGENVGDVDVGYGPARAISTAGVRAIHEQLRVIDESELRSRFNPVEMMSLDIYPTIWDRDPAVDDTFGYCADHFRELQRFVAEAAEKNRGIIIHLC
jgi:hypothetical protein